MTSTPKNMENCPPGEPFLLRPVAACEILWRNLHFEPPLADDSPFPPVCSKDFGADVWVS